MQTPAVRAWLREARICRGCAGRGSERPFSGYVRHARNGPRAWTGVHCPRPSESGALDAEGEPPVARRRAPRPRSRAARSPQPLRTVRVPEPVRAAVPARAGLRRALLPQQGLQARSTAPSRSRASATSCCAPRRCRWSSSTWSRRSTRTRGRDEARGVASNLLFDVAHAIGKADARSLPPAGWAWRDPIEKLSAGPIHFSFSGWAFVDIFAESHPTPDEDYFLIYDHPYSFESDAWLSSGRRSAFPVCVMNAGYSSGWCEESFGAAAGGGRDRVPGGGRAALPLHHGAAVAHRGAPGAPRAPSAGRAAAALAHGRAARRSASPSSSSASAWRTSCAPRTRTWSGASRERTAELTGDQRSACAWRSRSAARGGGARRVPVGRRARAEDAAHQPARLRAAAARQVEAGRRPSRARLARRCAPSTSSRRSWRAWCRSCSTSRASTPAGWARARGTDVVALGRDAVAAARTRTARHALALRGAARR